MTMARFDQAAYNFLVAQWEARTWIENVLGEKLNEDFYVATAGNNIPHQMNIRINTLRWYCTLRSFKQNLAWFCCENLSA